jgi:hypothetical protein
MAVVEVDDQIHPVEHPRTNRIVDVILQADEDCITALDCIILDTIINHCSTN